MRDQYILPTPVELGVVDNLVTFHSRARCVSAGADAFQVHDFRGWLHHHALAPRAHPKAEVDILVIRRREQFIEPTELFKQSVLDHQGSAGDVVGVTQEREGWFIWVAAATPIPAITQPPDDA